MKIIKVLAIAVLTITSYYINAQKIVENFVNWSIANPVEKVYLHLDRENYYAGQTIWFKGYFMSGLLPSSKSSSLYVELLNNKADVLLRKVFPAYLGSAMGQIDIPEALNSGSYIIRAYSPLMLNQPGFTFNTRIKIFGKEGKSPKNPEKQKKVNISFFPEGGNFVAGYVNAVAFKATDENGYPVDVTGEVKDSKNITIAIINSQHDGMGTFNMLPQLQDSYYAFVTVGGKQEKYPLPTPTNNGVAFTIRTSVKGKHFKLQFPDNKPDFKPAYIIGQMHNEIVFKYDLPDKKEINGVIETNNLYSGILHLTVFNKDDIPLAERLIFVDNKDYILPATLSLDSIDTSPRKRNQFSIALKDTIIGNFSVSVADADYECSEIRSQNIYTYFLLSADLRGYIHNPSYYFSNSVNTSLDLVMMTNGWTRFRWQEAKQNNLPKPVYKDSGYITLSGTINIEGTKRPLPDADIIMIMSPADTTMGKGNVTKLIRTDANGRFKLDSVIFYNKIRMLFSEIKGKKSKYIKVKLDADSLYRVYNTGTVDMPYKDSVVNTTNNKMATAYQDHVKSEGLLLESVTVRAVRKSEMEKLDEEYASGMFSGGINSRILDLRNENYGGGNIFQYLQGRVAGLQVNGAPGDYTLSFRGGGFTGNNVALFLDEMQTDANMIESIPISEIAMVKLIPNSIASFGGGTALAIYRKKGSDLMAATDAPTDIIYYNGYTVIKEFYNPDYSKEPANNKPDRRLTLSWNPNIFIANVNPKIPVVFYNNDNTKRFKIVVEGVTNDGRMLMLEKIIGSGSN